MNEKNNKKNEESPKREYKEKIAQKIGRIKSDIGKKIDVYLEKRKEDLNKNDVVFTEPISQDKQEREKTPVLVRSGIDNWFLLCVILLLIFGAIMSFSASSVYAENRYGDSGYFFKRYILYAFLSIIV